MQDFLITSSTKIKNFSFILPGVTVWGKNTLPVPWSKENNSHPWVCYQPFGLLTLKASFRKFMEMLMEM